ncbi:glutamine amidotransferase [Mesorhizobium sp. M7A.F.Ca.CA.001.09.2.1]|uniref:DJ-1/PfpI family protein n=1 Tax=Mesorhizobium ciceri TaxID=39645 RepID=A0AB38TG23_9HYPH|nr:MULTISPECIES: DJ-1/PfpI family protein [Mesorhizobium]RUY35164.1 glutamine amidotransferase [Mesorhizobium sp. M7A.F.Ca.CA.001.13.2.1]MDF3214490.1 DJ-1/PfpI family protein [Mesorhizobium ciceri]RUY62643.1 glutamine amidotransferase [Mesorhizobium sp. M7A.F.Ca.CA.001.05.1.1]RUY63397.1 glutamine amidotransferase [Mesorhizobium sp. M7A.F.Ca.CA.001.13.1.1]RUY79100.1 glutamine amidotransferase [Mesorhizobium sp. M7A.F.Ca.CA.001.09.2.1]
MPEQKTIGFLFIEGFADWEYGLLAASAVEWFGARAVSLTPDGNPVTGISGFRLTPDRSAGADENDDLDAIAVIGSDEWAGKAPPDVADLLNAVASRGGVVGGICAGTLALARAGLFENARHTSNGRDWINGHEAGYAGDSLYQDVPHAVADGKIVSSPGSAPGTFALAFLKTLYPERGSDLVQMRTLFAKEYAEAS